MAKIFASSALLIILAVAFAAADDVVVIEGEKDFEKAVSEHKNIVVEFYAPWCGHCKNLEPEWAKAATILKAEDPPILLAKCDATDAKNKELAQRMGVSGFPTMKIFTDGDSKSPRDYTGPRDADGIVKYLAKQFGPASKQILTTDEAVDFATKTVSMVAILPSTEGAEFEAFMAAAAVLRDDVESGHLTDASLLDACKDVGCEGATVLLFTDYSAPITKYEGAFEKEGIVAWAEKVSTPKLVEMNKSDLMRKHLQKVFGSKDPKFLAFIAADAADLDTHKTQLTELGASADGVQILYVDPADNTGAMQFFGLEAGNLPAVGIHSPVDSTKYVEKVKDAKDWATILQSFKDGKLEQHIKSEAVPEKNDGPVMVLVASEFDKVINSGKNVLIEFYAPWCGHCKKLAPVYEELGALFKNDDSVIIAKMDATANDVPDKRFNVRGFPTLVLVTAEGELVDFKGERSLEGLEKFVKDHVESAADDSSQASEDVRDEL